MFFRKVTTRRCGKEYVYLKLIETYRQGGKVKQRVIANFGNIERLTPEKITALIQGLARLHEGTGTPAETATPAQTQTLASLRATWHRLGLGRVIRESWPEVATPFDPAMATELMVLYLALNPASPQPVDRGCRELGIPEGQESLKAFDFYRTLELLPSIKKQIVCHLLQTTATAEAPVTNPGERVPWLVRILPSSFRGHECGLSSHGYTYQVRPYITPLDLAILVNPQGLPLDLAVAVNRPLAHEDLAALLNDLRQQVGAVFLVVTDGHPGASLSVPEEENWAFRVSPESLPQSLMAAMEGETPDGFWVRTLGRRQETFVVCHHPGLGEKANSSLDERLVMAQIQLQHIQRDIARRRLRRAATIADRVKKVLQRYECAGFIHWTYDETARQLTFQVREDTVERHKTRNRLLAFRTNLNRESVHAFVQAYLNSFDLPEYFGTVSDCTKLPVLYPYVEYHQSESVIRGHALVYFLAYLVRRLTPDRERW